MKKYTLSLKGTKKHGTEDLQITVLGDTKTQAFSHAYTFFQIGAYSNRTDEFIPDAGQYIHFLGKYTVYRTSVTIQK